MNLIDENNSNRKDSKKIVLALTGGIVILLFVIIGLIIYVMSQNSNKLKLYIDGAEIKNTSNYLLKKDNVWYIGIEELANKATENGYNFKKGSIDDEDSNKCYVINENESAFFEANSSRIYKITQETDEISFYTLDNPIIKQEQKFYIPLNSINVAMNCLFEEKDNQFNIQSMGKLKKFYSSKSSSDASFTPDNSIVWDVSYNSLKLLKKRMVIVKDSTEKLGLATVKYSKDQKNNRTVSTTTIISPKYESIEYVEQFNQLIVTSENGQKGIIQISDENDVTTIVTPQYKYIKPITEKLFLVGETAASSETQTSTTNTKISKYGIIGLQGTQILPISYDQVGIDADKFKSNDITSQYIIYDSVIPVKKDNVWGFIDLSGKVVVKPQYDDLGCVNTNNENNVLIVPTLNAIVVKKDGKYGLITKKNIPITAINLTKISKEVADGKTQFMVTYNNKKQELVSYINSVNK